MKTDPYNPYHSRQTYVVCYSNSAKSQLTSKGAARNARHIVVGANCYFIGTLLALGLADSGRLPFTPGLASEAAS